MTEILKKVYKGLPVKIEVRKPRYYYQDILTSFDSSCDNEINLVPFEGINYTVEGGIFSYDDKKLWNNKMLFRNEKCLAPSGRKYFMHVDGALIEKAGCLNDKTDDGSYATYVGYAKNSDIILCEGEDEVEGYTWIGEVVVPEHNVTNHYLKNYVETNTSVTYSVDDGSSIWCSLKSNGQLSLLEQNIFNVASPSYFNYTIRMTAKIMPSDTNGYRKLFVFDGIEWFGTFNGKLCLYDTLTVDEVLSANVCYWVRLTEVFLNGQYTQSISYILDDGYEFNNLPDDSLWTVNSATSTTPLIDSNVKLISIGCDETNNRSWYGKVDLLNTKVEFISEGFLTTWWKPFINF